MVNIITNHERNKPYDENQTHSKLLRRCARSWNCALTGPAADTEVTTAEARAIAEEAYVFGFAIVEYYKGLWAYAVEPKSPKYADFNTLRSEARLYGPEDTAVVSANNDALYTSAVMDLRIEPVILQVPEVTDRYYSFMLFDTVTTLPKIAGLTVITTASRPESSQWVKKL